LRRAKEFFYWCVREKLIAQNPFVEVKPIGKPNTGKPQLRQDEAKRLSDLLIDCAGHGDASALALLVQVLLGLRSSEVLKLRKRDLDRNGSVLVIEGTKMKNARRTLSLDSPIVRRLLAQHVASLEPDALIFAATGRENPFATDHLYKKLRGYCKRAGVPIVCPHSLRGLHSSLAVQVGATSAHVAQALGHSSDQITRKHYLAPGTLEASRTARLSEALLGDGKIEALLAELRTLPPAQLDHIAHELGFRRVA
jgi:integrase